MSNAPFMSFCRHLAGPVYRLLFPAKVVDRQYLVEAIDQPLIIVANHHSNHDPLQLIVRCPRNLHFLAKKELFDGSFGWFFRSLGLISVNRDQHNSGVSQAEKYLQQGRIVAIFPEGTTKFKRANQLLPFKYGTVRLARDTNASILPVAITGKPTLFRRRVTVRFGKSYRVGNDIDIDTATKDLQAKVLELMKQSGVKDAAIIPGKPVPNPSKRPPIR